MSSRLFSPLVLRGVEFANRIMVAPRCQASVADGSTVAPWRGATEIAAGAVTG